MNQETKIYEHEEQATPITFSRNFYPEYDNDDIDSPKQVYFNESEETEQIYDNEDKQLVKATD